MILPFNISGIPSGFVSMPNGHEAMEAIELMQGVMLFGKSLRLCAVVEVAGSGVSKER